MNKYALKQIARVALFMVFAIWGAMLMIVALFAMAAASGAAGDPVQPKAIWVLLVAAILMCGNAYILAKIWEWK